MLPTKRDTASNLPGKRSTFTPGKRTIDTRNAWDQERVRAERLDLEHFVAILNSFPQPLRFLKRLADGLPWHAGVAAQARSARHLPGPSVRHTEPARGEACHRERLPGGAGWGTLLSRWFLASFFAA